MSQISSRVDARMAEPEAEVPGHMDTVRVPGDGLCLFHALSEAVPTVGQAASLRAAIIEYLLDQAPLEGDDGRLWSEEASKLAADPEKYGGHMVIVAFSKMTNQQVIVHDTKLQRKYQATHPSVSEDAHCIHLLYNGVNHYDLLVQRVRAKGSDSAVSAGDPRKTYENLIDFQWKSTKMIMSP